MGSTKRTDLKLAMFLAITPVTLLVVLPGFLRGRAATTEPLVVQKEASSSLDGARQAALEKLYAQLKAGASFSDEERAILRRFGSGETLTDLEADVVISRALHDYYISGKELTKEQQELLDRYVLFVSRRNQEIADIKAGYHNKQRQRAITAPDVNCSSVTPPPNDNCSGAQVIPGAGPFPVLTTSVDICAATLGGDPPSPTCEACTLSPTFGTLTRSVWYTFTPTTTASYTISTCQVDTATTDGDPVMAIYTSTGGCAGPFTLVPFGCDDDTCADPDLGLRSIISNIPLNSGTQYFIVVWTCTTGTPQQGETTLQLKVSRTTIPSNDTCAGQIPLALNTRVNGTNLAAINDYQLSGTTCFTGVGQTSSTATGRDVVYSFTAPSTDTYSFRVTNYSFFGNLVMYATTSCPAATPGVPVNITCNNVSGPAIAAANRSSGSTSEELLCLSLTTGQQIFIFVDDNIAAATFLGDTFTIEANRCSLETEANNTPGTANAIVFGGEGSLNPSGDVDFFSLGTPASGSRVFAMIDGVASNNSDYDMRVTTTTDTLEYDDLNNDALFGSFSPNIGGTPLTGVASFIRVDYFPASSAAHEPYRIYSVVQPPGANALPSCPSLTTSATSETEPNNTSAQANSASNNYFSGSLSGATPSTDVDVFSFAASAGQLVFISLDGDPCRNNTPIDGKLELLSGDGSTVLVSVNDGGFTSSTTPAGGSLTATTPFSPAEGLVFRAAATGTYFVRVSIGTTFAQPYGAGDYLLSIFTSGPTAAKFSNDGGGNTASATRYHDGVSVKWRTGFEVDNLGFNVYREENGKRARANSLLIAGSALMVGAGTTLGAGRSYAWFDNAPASSNARYWIEAFDLNGEGTWHGPIEANLSAGKSESVDQAWSPTLGQLGKSTPQVSETARIERRATIRSVGASGVSIQLVVAGQSAAKLGVKSEGLYRVTQPELASVGFNSNVDPSNLRLFADGQEQPINVIAKDKFDASAAIEFYGVGLDSAATDERVYWLVGGTQAGLRIEQIPAQGGAGAGQSFLSTVELKQRTVYFSALRNGEKENFFGAIIASNPVDQALVLQHVDTGSANGAMLEVGLQGVTLAGHRVEVRINGLRAGEVVFNGQAAGVGRLSIAQSQLKEGANVVRLAPLGGPSDISLVDYVRLTYWHTFFADNDQLRFNVAARQVVSVDGFSNGLVRVFDVTDTNSPQEILGTVKPSKSGYSVTLKVQGSGLRTLLAMTNGTAKRAANISLDQPSTWRQPGNAASFVIFTRREFMPALDGLKELRQSQGYKVAVVDIEDVYDEFSYGNRTPQALKDFLAYARSNWKIAPRFVLLAGDASYDPKNYLGFGAGDLVPTKLIDTQFMETASDDWLSDFDGDGLAEMAIGRLPVRSAGEAANLVAKLIGYEKGARSEGVLLVADDSRDGVDFEAISNELRGVIPSDQRVEQINRGGLDPATAKAQLLEAINRGQKVVNYDGHGNVDAWRGGLLTLEDVRSMYNADTLSLFVMMTCLNGYFHEAQIDSLAEALIKAEKGGAVAVWASSGMTSPGDQGVIDVEMFKRLFDTASPRTLGEMALRAKAKGLNKDARLTWILLGDPATTIE